MSQVLKDEQTLAEASVSEQGFLVVMVTKVCSWHSIDVRIIMLPGIGLGALCFDCFCLSRQMQIMQVWLVAAVIATAAFVLILFVWADSVRCSTVTAPNINAVIM